MDKKSDDKASAIDGAKDSAINSDVAPGQKPEEAPESREKEFGGPKGPEPTRYGDWERKGIVSDF